MRHALRQSPERIGWSIWIAILVVISIRVLLSDPRTHSVYPNFAEASRNWIKGADLYRHYDPISRETLVSAHRYGPLVAVLLIPLSLLPERLGGVFWRLINAAVFLGGLVWWTRASLPRILSRKEFGIFLLLLIPTSLDSLNNGQSNPLTIGLLMAGCAAVAQERWNWAGMLMALAALFKVYPIAVGLLLVLLYLRKFSPRFVPALAIGAALPFLCQSAGYVWSQYVDWFDLLRRDDRKFWPLSVANRDLWLLFRVYHLPITRTCYLMLQLLSAALVAGVCLALQRIGCRTRDVLTEALAMGCCWMTLLGPATEAATYILLAPILAWTLLEIRSTNYSGRWRGIAYASFGLFLVALLAGLFPNTSEVHALGLHPLGTLLLWSVRGHIVWVRIFQYARRNKTVQGFPPHDPIAENGSREI